MRNKNIKKPGENQVASRRFKKLCRQQGLVSLHIDRHCFFPSFATEDFGVLSFFFFLGHDSSLCLACFAMVNS